MAIVQPFGALVNICAIGQAVAAIAGSARALEAAIGVRADANVRLAVVQPKRALVLIAANEAVADVAGSRARAIEAAFEVRARGPRVARIGQALVDVLTVRAVASSAGRAAAFEA